MRKILLILDGIVAKRFLEALVYSYPGINSYEVVYYDQKLIPEIVPENFVFHKFDPTSYSKLSHILNSQISEVFIVLAKKDEIVATYKNVRYINKKIKICILDEIEIEADDANLIRINPSRIIANRIVQKLPNIPVTAQNIGLGIGEMMEVSIPFGSTYSYRFIGSIEQKNWRIAAIYRDGKLLMADEHIAIQPNDNLLIIGDPNVLSGVYRSIKKELGLFPLPFGSTIYFYFDMLIDSQDEIKRCIKNALYLRKRLKNRKLIIRIANPTDPDFFGVLKNMDSKDVAIHFDFTGRGIHKLILSDTRQFSAGLIGVSSKIFKEHQARRALFDAGVPVLKLGVDDIDTVEEIVVFLSGSNELENISPIVYDIASQLEIKIFLYDSEDHKNQEIIEHYENLARIYSKNINIVKSVESNPIIAAKKREPFLQILPFAKEVTKKHYFWFFSTNIEKLYFKLDRFNQLFIPLGD